LQEPKKEKKHLGHMPPQLCMISLFQVMIHDIHNCPNSLPNLFKEIQALMAFLKGQIEHENVKYLHTLPMKSTFSKHASIGSRLLKHSQWQILNTELPCVQTRVLLHCSVFDCLHKVQEEKIHVDEFT
jgi:hypothetical protein